MENMPSILTPDFGLLFWMLLAFGVVFFLLAKYGFPAITKAVEDRKNYIDESLKNAREANEKLANVKAESESILKAAHEQQARIIKEAISLRRLVTRHRQKGNSSLKRPKSKLLLKRKTLCVTFARKLQICLS